MAVFNPQVSPTQDPNYFRYSEPISNIQNHPYTIASSGEAIAGVGNAIEGGAKLTDQTVKDVIKDDVYKKVDYERDSFTSALNTVRDSQRGSLVPAPVQTDGGSTATDITATGPSQAPVPAALDIGLGKVDAVQAALVNGKINDTYYSQRLNTVAVEMRAKYPGYRDYIDQRISEATGMNPANAYVNNLMQDINRQAQTKDKEYEKTETRLTRAVDDHVPNADIMLNAWRSKSISQPRVEEFLYKSQSEKAALDLNQARRANSNGNLADIKTQRTSDFTQEVGASIANNFHALVTIPGVDTPQGIMDFMKVVASHPEQYTDAQMRTLDTQIMSQRAVVYSQFKARSNETSKDAQGKSYSFASDIGADSVESILKSQLAAYDNIHEALTGGGPQGAGLAFWHANQVTARFADAHEKMLSGTLGNDLKTFKILSDDLGPTLSSVIMPKIIAAGVPEKMAGLFSQSASEARAQPDFDKNGRPITFEQHAQAADQLEKDGKINRGMKARYFDSLTKVGEDIQDPNIPDVTKVKVVKYLFSPEGQGMLSHFNTDYTNSEGKFVPGKYKVYNALTSQGMVDNITKLAKTDPSIGTMYKNYLENEAGSQLFYKEFQNLNRYTGHDDLHFTYDNGDTNNGIPFIKLTDKEGKPVVTRQPTPGMWNRGTPSQDPEYLFRINETVGRINQGLAGLGRVEKGLNGDVNSYILNFLQTAQVNLGQNWTGLPAKLADAIAASRAPAKRIDEVFKDIK